MEEVNRRRRTVLQVQVGELHLWRLNQSSSPRKCTSHLGLRAYPKIGGNLQGELREGKLGLRLDWGNDES